jgi:ketopantoate reductase
MSAMFTRICIVGAGSIGAIVGGRLARAAVDRRGPQLQDVMRGRRTEIDYLNGYVVEQGRAAVVATPFNEAAVCLFRERGVRLTPSRQNLEPLLRLLPRPFLG